jgi:TP901 family phage tail tape measure protein
MNIQVRVLTAQARQQLAALQKQLGGLNFGSAAAGAGAFGNALSTSRLDRFGSQMQWLGRQIEYNFTVPLAIAGGAATKFSLDNEAALTRVKKVYGDGTQSASEMNNEIKSLQKAFVALSNQFGINQADTINIAADWAAAGASGLALAKSVQLTMKTMVLGELEASDATKSLIAIQAQYGLSIKELADAIDILNMVENQTGISMSGLIDGFVRAAGVARSSGVGVRELAADLAALVPATGSAANAGNALKTIFSRIISPTKQTSEVLGLMGVNTRALAWESANGQQKLIMMAQAFDKLSDSQKGVVSSIIASRYQVNRFEVLMKELLSTNGYYAKALSSTSDMTKVYAQSQKELNLVLTSNPQRLKQIWVMLQNASADIIQPLIPLILYLAMSIQRLVQWFSNLNPALQKFILFGFAMLAIIGPVVRYLGAFQVLLFEVGKAVSFAMGPIAWLLNAFRIIITIPIQAYFAAVPLALRSMWIVMSATAMALPRLWAGAMIAVQAVQTAATFAMTVGWRGLMVAIELLTVSGFARVRTAMIAGYAAMRGSLIAFAAFWTATWRFMTMNPILFVSGLFTRILVFMRGIIPAIRIAATAIGVAMTGPVGAVIVGLVVLVALFWKQIKQVFTNVINWFRSSSGSMGQAFAPFAKAAEAVRNITIKAFNALPEGVRNALLAVVRIVASAAEQIYKWFQYINPWARHSPSLVDNVTTGVAEIKNQFASLFSVGSAFAHAGNDLEIFGRAVRKVQDDLDTSRYNDIRKTLAAYAPEAMGSFNSLIVELRALNDELDNTKKQLDAQQAIVDNWKQKLDDANNNLTYQKDILDALKDTMDGVQNKMDAINGLIELTSGTQKALRDAGAGSEILKSYDDQLNALRDQKKGVQDQFSAARKAYLDQKKLVDDLTLARDKLQASYDMENAKLGAIQDAYDRIHQRIQDITGAISDFESAVNSLESKKAKDPSQVAQDFTAGANGNFPDVGGSGSIGRENPGITDQSKMIDDFTKGIADQTKKMFGMFDFLEPIKKAWNKAWDWVKTTFGPLASLIWNGLKSAFSNIPNPFAGIDANSWLDFFKGMFDTLKGWWDGLWRLIGPPLREIVKVIKDEFGKAMEAIGPQLRGFKDLLGPIGDLFKVLWDILKPIAAIIGGALLLALNILLNVLKNVLGPVIDFVVRIITSFLQILRGLIEFVVGVFTGNWALAWQGIKDIFIGIWNAIWALIKDFGLLIWGVIKGVVEGIVGFFKWLWDELVGHSIIPDIINGIIGWFKSFKDWAMDIWNAWWDGLKTILGWVKDGFNAWWQGVITLWNQYGKPLFDGIKNAFGVVGQFLSDKFNWVKNEWNIFMAGLKVLYDQYLAPLWDRFKSALGSVKDTFQTAINGIRTIWDGLKAAASDPVNFVIGTVINRGLIKGWNWLSDNVLGGKFHANTIPGYKSGGPVNGPGTDKSDSIWARLSRGEFVIPANIVRAYGIRFFNSMIGKNGQTTRYPGDGSSGLAFAGGGFVGDIWDAFTNPGKILANSISGLLGKVPGAGPFVNMAKSIPGIMIDKMIDRAKSLFNSEGPVGKAMVFLKEQIGRPYIWASAGPDGYDCSGIVSAIYNIMHDKNPYNHTFSTMNQQAFFPQYGGGTSFYSAWTNPGERGIGGSSVGHTMGVLGGAGFQSTGGHGVDWVSASNTRNFAHIGHYDNGGWLLPGRMGINTGWEPEPVFNARQWSKIDAVLRARVFQMDQNGAVVPGGGYNHTEIHFHGDLSFPNVRDSKDADEFIKNLESLVRGV